MGDPYAVLRKALDARDKQIGHGGFLMSVDGHDITVKMVRDLLDERDLAVNEVLMLHRKLAEANADNEELLRELPSLREQITQTHAGFVAENARLRAALVLAREAIAGMPASLGYEYTHLRAIDAALRGDAA